MMLYQIKDAYTLPHEVINQLQNHSYKKKNRFQQVGSCLYNLRSLKILKQDDSDTIADNARCNFELFPKGYLLRINDKNKLFVMPLTFSSDWRISYTRGEEYIRFNSLSYLLYQLGVDKSFLKRYWILSNAFCYTRFKMEIVSDDFHIKFDANGSEYTSAIKFFNRDSEMKDS